MPKRRTSSRRRCSRAILPPVSSTSQRWTARRSRLKESACRGDGRLAQGGLQNRGCHCEERSSRRVVENGATKQSRIYGDVRGQPWTLFEIATSPQLALASCLAPGNDIL